MRVGVVVNTIAADTAGQTTSRLAARCAHRGHETWLLTNGRFTFDSDDRIRAWARTAPAGTYRSTEAYVEALRSTRATERWITIDDLDVLLLRSNPAAQSPWARAAGIDFGRLAMRRGVVVLNDPNGLAKAANKLYLQTFPDAVRPVTIVTRSTDRIRALVEEHGAVVVKPLQGYGGANVFVCHAGRPGLDDIVRAVTRDGYAVAQEYLPEAAAGDTRLFLMNGEPLRHRGQYCAFRRVRTGDDLRSNLHAGGRLRRAVVTDRMLRLAEMVRPRLVEDGMFLVGLDIAGDKLMEVNVFSPGGIGSAQMFTKVDFAEPIVDALEHKVSYMTYYRRGLGNVDLATL